MPFKSQKQERWAHADAGEKKLGKPEVAEFDQASKGLKLPKVSTPKAPSMPKDPMPKPFNPMRKSNWDGR